MTLTGHERHTASAQHGRGTQNHASGEHLGPLGLALRDATDGRWGHVRAQARERLRGEDFRCAPGLGLEEARAWAAEKLKTLADGGYGRDGFPVEYGGGGDLGGSIASFEVLAHGDLSLTVKSGVHFGLFGGAVTNLGTERHHKRYLPAIMSADLPGCFAMTEVGHGSDVQSLETTITYDAGTGDLVVHSRTPTATKTYIGGAARDARLAVVFGQLHTGGAAHGVHAVLVPLRDEQGSALPGITLGDNGHKGGLPGVDNGTITFDQVRVPRENLLNRYGDVEPDGTYSSSIENEDRRFFTMLGTLVRGRVSVAGGAGSAARTALSIATRYALARRQFTASGREGEVVLMDYLAHQRKLLPAIASSYALMFAQDELVRTMHDVQSAEQRDQVAQRELETRAAGLKAVTTSFANTTIQTCREACGGAGYLAENRLVQLRADTDVFATFEGDNTVLLQLVAKGLLTHYQAMFGDLDMLGMVQFATKTYGGAIIERTAARPLIERLVDAASRRSDDETMLDRGWHLSMFEERERHVLESLAQRMRNAGKDSADAFAAFNMTQDHVLLAARVHIDRVVLEAFVAGIEACEDERAAEVLGTLCDLYALSNLESDKGWFLEHNRMSDGRAKAITTQVNQLCEQLRPDALSLVEGFGIPVDWLGARMLTEPPGAPAED